MGFNSVLFQNNDTLHNISDNPQRWAELVVRALGSGTTSKERNSDLYHEFGTQVVAVEHSSGTIIIASGGGHASILGAYSGNAHHNDEERIKIIKRLAEDHGFELTSKKKR
jgi:arginase family enzyme